MFWKRLLIAMGSFIVLIGINSIILGINPFSAFGLGMNIITPGVTFLVAFIIPTLIQIPYLYKTGKYWPKLFKTSMIAWVVIYLLLILTSWYGHHRLEESKKQEQSELRF